MSHVDTVYGFKWLRTNVLHVHSRHKESSSRSFSSMHDEQLSVTQTQPQHTALLQYISHIVPSSRGCLNPFIMSLYRGNVTIIYTRKKEHLYLYKTVFP